MIKNFLAFINIFNPFKKRCLFCNNSNLTGIVEREKNYGSRIFTEIVKCKNCGSESRKTTVIKRKDVIPDKFKTL